jgi:hypothetical protein
MQVLVYAPTPIIKQKLLLLFFSVERHPAVDRGEQGVVLVRNTQVVVEDTDALGEVVSIPLAIGTLVTALQINCVVVFVRLLTLVVKIECLQVVVCGREISHHVA